VKSKGVQPLRGTSAEIYLTAANPTRASFIRARRTFMSGPPGISTPTKKDMSALTAFLGKGALDGTG